MNKWQGSMLCAWAVILAWGFPARADEAGQAVVKTARWHAPSPAGLAELVAVPGGGPVMAVGEKSITALDRASGKALWTVTEGLDHPLYVGAGDKVILIKMNIVPGPDGVLIGLSRADGSVSYKIPMPKGSNVHVMGHAVVIDSNHFSIRMPMYIIEGGPVELTAYDIDTGKDIWHKTAPDRDASTEFRNSPLIEMETHAERDILDSATGRVLWTYTTPKDQVYGAVRGDNGAWYLLERAGEGPYKLFTRDMATGKVVGQINMENAVGYPAAATGQMVVMHEPRKTGIVGSPFSDFSQSVELTEEEKKDQITVLNIQTGKAVWTAKYTADSPSTRVRVAGDLVLAGTPYYQRSSSYWGPWTMIVLDLATGKNLWSQKVDTNVAIYKDIMVFAADEQWMGVNRRDGKPLWSVPCDKMPCDPLLADGVLYLAVARGGAGAASEAGIYALPLEGNAAMAGPKP